MMLYESQSSHHPRTDTITITSSLLLLLLTDRVLYLPPAVHDGPRQTGVASLTDLQTELQQLQPLPALSLQDQSWQ